MYFQRNKPFICPHCGKDFKTKRQLKSHIKDKHPNEVVKNEQKEK